MSYQELTMPKMGESVAEATIIRWVKNEGDSIKMDEVILEIATDKVDSEIPSPFEGTLVKKLFKEGDVIQVGAVIAQISGGIADTSSASAAKPTQVAVESTRIQQVTPVTSEEKEVVILSNSAGRFYSPLVKNIAKSEGISQQELDSLKGSGKDGRVTKSDILSYLPNRGNGQSVEAASVKIGRAHV